MTEKIESGKMIGMNLNKNLLSQLNRVKLLFGAAVIGGLAAGVFVLFQARVLSKIINQVFLEQNTLLQVKPFLWKLLLIIISRFFIFYFSEIVSSRLAIQVKTNLRQNLIQKIGQLGPNFTRQQQSSQLISAAIKGVETLDTYFGQYLPQIILAALVPLTFLVFVFPLDFLSALVLILTAPLIPLFMFLIGKNAEKLTGQQWGALTRLSTHFYDTLKGLTTLKTLNQSLNQKKIIREIDKEYLTATMSVLRVTFLSALALELISTLSTAVVAVQIGLRLLHGGIPFEEAFFILLIAPEFYLPLRNLGLRFHAGMNGVSASKDIFKILDHPGGNKNLELGSRDLSLNKNLSDILAKDFTISFRNVKYRYEARNENALNGITFDLKKGSLTALVGPNGAGKSTTADLLMQFIEPIKGEITLGELSLHSIPTDEWQKLISWVPQHPYLFQGTILENIRLANPNAANEKIIGASRLANLDEFVTALPQGYETLIGENGLNLSGGQAKRLALARAFLKDAPLLIMDEPTAHLDPQQEHLLKDSTEKICQTRTVLIIAHRISTILNADNILVLDQGRIIQKGNHKSLLQEPGLYLNFVRAFQGEA